MYHSTQTLILKQSNAFALYVVYKDDDGKPINLSDKTINSDIKTATGQLITSCKVQIIDMSAGQFLLTIDDNIRLPLESLYLDVAIMSDGKAINSDIVKIEVMRTVTGGS